MLLWKSVPRHREEPSYGIIADRDVLGVGDWSIWRRHQYYTDTWNQCVDTWCICVNLRYWDFGYSSIYYDGEHNVLSFGPFYIYWS